MRSLRASLIRFTGLLRRTRTERELAAELQSHLDMHAADNIRGGMPHDEARRQALIAMGGLEQTKERYRDASRIRPIAELVQDLRFAARLLIRDRAFTSTVTVVLGLGIAVTNTFFILTNATCLRSLPLDEPDRVVFVHTRDAGDRNLGMSYEDVKNLKASAQSLTAIGAFTASPMAVGDDTRAAERFAGAYVSADVFRLLGEVPLAGRDFQPEDDRPGAPSVVILGQSVWEGRYASDPSIMGRTIRMNGVPSTVIGIMPDRSKFPTNTEVWQPLAAMPGIAKQTRDVRTLAMIARLTDESTPTEARAELESIWSQLAKLYPDTNGNIRLTVMPINERYLSDINEPTWLAFIAAGCLVLLVACANVANLLLMHGTHRAREIAIRASLGATRPRVIRQLLAESVLLAVLGGMLGLGLSLTGARLLWLIIPAGTLPYWMHFTMDGPIFAAFAVVCLGTSLIFGVVPAFQMSRSNPNVVLKDGGRGGSRGVPARRWTSAFLVLQFAVALVFLVSVSLAVRFLADAERRDPQIEMERLLTTSIALSAQKYNTAEQRTALYEELIRRLESSSMISSATISSALPLGGAGSRQLFVEGKPPGATGPRPTAWTVVVGPTYFQTLGLSLVRGRAFVDRDGAAGHQNVVVNQRFAEMHFSKIDPIGKRIGLGVRQGSEPPAWLTIVGVSPSVRQRTLPDPDPIVYLPYRADPPAQASVIVRGPANPLSAAPVVRAQLRSLDADLPLYRVMTLEQAVKDANWNGRVSNLMANFITLLAVLLSAVGLYALTSHAVAQLTPEIGIRVALGAQPREIIWSVLRRALVQLGMGLAAGVLLAFAWNRAFSGPDNASRPIDVFAAAAMLSFVAFLACLLPALRATRVNPVVALRYE